MTMMPNLKFKGSFSSSEGGMVPTVPGGTVSTSEWTCYPGTVINVMDKEFLCDVKLDNGSTVLNAILCSPLFNYTDGSGMYYLPVYGARVLMMRGPGNVNYIISGIPMPTETDLDGSKVLSHNNSRSDIQQGDTVLSTPSGNFIKLRNFARMLHISNGQRNDFIMMAKDNKTYLGTQRLRIEADAGHIEMQSSANEKGEGKTWTSMFFRANVKDGDDKTNFVKIDIGDLGENALHSDFTGSPPIIFSFNVCNKFTITIDTSGNIKAAGNESLQTMIGDIVALSGGVIADMARETIQHERATGGGFGPEPIPINLENITDFDNIKYDLPEPGSSGAKGHPAYGGNSGYGGEGGYTGDDNPTSSPGVAWDLPESADTIDKIIHNTAINEGAGKYDAWTGNDNGHGLSFGLIQWNQQVGGLPYLMQRMNEADPQKFDQYFGQYKNNLLNPDWIRTTNDFKTDPALKAAMKAAASDPVFQKVQRDVARDAYMAPAIKSAKKLSSATGTPITERDLALLFDSSVQSGPGGMDRKLTAALRGGGSKADILRRFATSADSVAYSNNRRTKILASTKITDNPVPGIA